MAYLEYAPTSTLFYYTDIGGFEGIVRSKQLWLSDITASNDPRELALGENFLAAAVKAYKTDEVLGTSNRDMAEFLAEVLSSRRKSTYFSCSFALARDSLPLWREYAGGGTGLCIGFRPTAISSIPGRMQLVRYEQDDMKDFFRSVVLQIAANMGKTRTVPRVLAMAEAFALISSIKHRSWEYEREARIIVNQRNSKPDAAEIITQMVSLHPDGREVHWREPMTRRSRDRDVGYLPFEYGRYSGGKADPRRSIESVHLGPKCLMSSAEVDALLVAEGFAGFRVLKSECAVQ